MGRYQSSKRTYSKVPVQPVDSHPRRSQRKNIPKFTDLYVARDENTQPAHLSDIFDSISTKHKKSEDAPENLSLRKPLAVSSFLTNSSVGSASHVSVNDTFDRFTKQLTRPQVPLVIGCSSSTSGTSSSFDVTGVLYKSLQLESDSRLANSTGTSTGDAILKTEHRKIKADVTRSKAVGTEQNVISEIQNCNKNYHHQYSRKNEQIQLCTKQELSSQRFTLDYDNVVSGNEFKRRAPKRYGLRSQKKSTDIVNSVTYEQQTYVKSDPAHLLKQSNAIARVSSNNNKALACGKVKHSPSIRQTFSTLSSMVSTVQTAFSPKLSANHNILSNQHMLSSEKQTPHSIEYPHGSTLSGKLKTSREICTSTPAESSRNQNVLRKGSHWSLQASPSLENSVSPVPRQGSMVVEENSSVFETPECLKAQNQSSAVEIRSSLTSGSKYETCKENNVEISSNIPQVNIGASDLIKENIPKSSGSFYNSSRVLSSGPFKGACIPALELAGSTLPKGTLPCNVDCTTTIATEEEQCGLETDLSVVISRKGRAATIRRAVSIGESHNSKRETTSVFSSPYLRSPRKTRCGSILLKQVQHLEEMNSQYCLGNSVDTDNFTSRDLIEQECSVVFSRKTVKRVRDDSISAALLDFKKPGDSIVSKTSQATEDSDAVAGKLTSDTSQLSLSAGRQSPVVTRKQAKIRFKKKENQNFSIDMFDMTDTSDDIPSLPRRPLREHVMINNGVRKKAARRSKSLAVKPVVPYTDAADEGSDVVCGDSVDMSHLSVSTQSLILTRRQRKLGLKKVDNSLYMKTVLGNCLSPAEKSLGQQLAIDSSLWRGAPRRSKRLARKSIANCLASVTKNSDMFASVTEDMSHFSLSSQSPIFSGKLTRLGSKKENYNSSRDMSHKWDISGNTLPSSTRCLRQHVKLSSPLGKVATRKCKRLSVKPFVTTRQKQNRCKKLRIKEFSSLSITHSDKRHNSVKGGGTSINRTSKFFDGERSEGRTESQKADFSHRVCPSESIKEELDFDIESDLHGTDESVCDSRGCRERNDSMRGIHSSLSNSAQRNSVRSDSTAVECVSVKFESENLRNSDELKSQKIFGEEAYPNSLVNQKCCLNSAGDGYGISLQLEEELGPLPSFCATPAKPGKGWKRSLRSMIPLQGTDSAERDWMRRETVHCLAALNRKKCSLRMSAIPIEMDQRIKLIVSNTGREINRRSSFQITYLGHDMSSDVSIPQDPQDRVLRLCSQDQPVPLTDCFTESRLACCKKIGEGVYGEVFMTCPNPASLEEATVLKVMPIEGDFDVNGEPQKKFEEIFSEIVISVELSSLRSPDQKLNWSENYVHLLSCWCVQGSYPEDLLQLWDQFHEEKGSENDRPDIFPDTQLYVVLEFGHGGRDLESYLFNNARDAYAIFLQVAYSLSVAEQELEFEHRDLHWGNVLVAPTRKTTLGFKVSGDNYVLKTHGVKATVIDFTLSRLKTQHCVVYNNLAEDPSLFTAEGDYQFEIYRQMKKANRNEWEKFTPYTNVLWLHYLLDKMMTECYYKNTKSKLHSTHLATLAQVKEKILSYESASHFVHSRELEAHSV